MNSDGFANKFNLLLITLDVVPWQFDRFAVVEVLVETFIYFGLIVIYFYKTKTNI